jgi:hypothetical protein
MAPSLPFRAGGFGKPLWQPATHDIPAPRARKGRVSAQAADGPIGHQRTCRRNKPPALPVEHASSTVSIAPLVLGSRRSETGLCEIGAGELARARRGHETRATRADRDNCFATDLMAAPVCCYAGRVGPNGRPGHSIRSGISCRQDTTPIRGSSIVPRESPDCDKGA